MRFIRRVFTREVLCKVSRKLGSGRKTGDQHLAYLVQTLNRQVRAFNEIGVSYGHLVDQTLADTRTSDTVFIMGSGPSINSFSRSNLQEIAAHDSIGFNFFLVHEMVTSHYLLQLPPPGPFRSSLIELLKLRQSDYQDSQIMVRGDKTFRGPLSFGEVADSLFGQKKVWFLPELAINSRVQIDPYQMMEFFSFLGLLSSGVVGRAVPKWRGTLGLALSLAYQMGYENIVLCGFDMQDSTHFYDAPVYENRFPALVLPKPGDSNIDTFESTAHSTNTVSRYVSEFARFAQERSDTRVFLASRYSRLQGLIPNWTFDSDSV